MNTKNTVASPSHPVWFPDWAEGLSRSGLPVSVRQQYRNAIVEFLRFCKQTRQRATVASARQFMQALRQPIGIGQIGLGGRGGLGLDLGLAQFGQPGLDAGRPAVGLGLPLLADLLQLADAGHVELGRGFQSGDPGRQGLQVAPHAQPVVLMGNKLLTPMNDLTVLGNLLEAGLWVVFSAVFGVMAFRSSGRRRRLTMFLAVAFFAFGVSDVIESRTGAWWRPPALCVLKASCVAVFLYGVFEYRSICRAQKQPSTDAGPGKPAMGREAEDHRN